MSDRVVVICGESWRHRYFASRLSEEFNVVGVVNERMKAHFGAGFLRRSYELARGFRFNPFAIYAKSHCRVLELARARGVNERILGPKGFRFHLRPGAEHLRFESKVNAPQNVEQIRALKPDVLAVSGARLLSKKIIEIPTKAAINMHGGLSPYYRGGDSIFWALYNREPQCVGVTIHLLTLGIDAGPLLYTGRPDLEADDNEMTLFAKIYRLGCELMVQAVRDALADRLSPVPQWTKGRLYFRKDRKVHHYRRMIRDLKSGLLATHLREHRRREGDIRLIGDPSLLAEAKERANRRATQSDICTA